MDIPPMSKIIHTVFTIANETDVPHYNWLAERSSKDPEVKLSFLCLYKEKPKMLERVGAFGCDCYWVQYDDSKKKTDMFKAIWKTYKILKKIRPDAIHTHLFEDTFISLIAARMADVKVRVNTRGDANYHFLFAPKGIYIDRFNNWNSTHILAISDESKALIERIEKPKPSKLRRVHLGIPFDYFTKQKQEDKQYLETRYQLKGKKIIGTVARLVEWKGHKYIIEAAAKIIQDFPDVVFVFAGADEGYKIELEQLVQKLDLKENIIFAGRIDWEKMPSFYGLLDIYVHAASFEPFGFVYAEAMMNGAPVVSTKTGAAMDAITHLENGYLVDYKDSEGLASGIRFMLTQNLSELKAETKKIGKEMFDFEVMYQNYVSLYKEALNLATREASEILM